MWRVAAGPVHETGDAAGGRCGKRVMWWVVAGSVRETGDMVGGGGLRAWKG